MIERDLIGSGARECRSDGRKRFCRELLQRRGPGWAVAEGVGGWWRGGGRGTSTLAAGRGVEQCCEKLMRGYGSNGQGATSGGEGRCEGRARGEDEQYIECLSQGQRVLRSMCI